MAGRGKRDGLDLFHGTNFKMRTTGRFGGVVTIHDLWLDRYPAYSTKLFGQRWSFVRTRRTARRARKVVTVSTHAAGEIEALYGLPRTHLRVVPNGVAPEFTVRPAASTIQAVLQRLGIGERPYVLFVGGADPRKNHRTLIKAFARALPDVKGHLLVLVGDAVHRFGNYHESVRAEGVEEAVRCPGRVSFEDLRALYAGAALFAFPSRYEGFGMPVLEAMACRVPVITSNTTSLPEVAGEAAMLVNPLDDKELGEAMVRVLSDQKLAEDLRTKGMERAKQFTWERTARRTFAVYREVVEQG
jgi:glycosyltransferase involved in cell wall biosynthesis